MSDIPPHAVILAGPNGAGKSTSAPALLRDYLNVVEFVNADTIAQGLSAFRPEATALQASRLLLERVNKLVLLRESFAIETTLATRSLMTRIPEWQAVGFRVDLHFLWLPTVELAMNRVALRVQSGGHDIPAATIRRRYDRGLFNFCERYRNIVDRWIVYDASSEVGPERVAETQAGTPVVHDAHKWSQIETAN